MLLSTRHSYLGITSPLLRSLLRELVMNLSTSRLEAKHPPSDTTLFLQQYKIMLQGVAVGVHNTTYGACFSEEGAFIPLEDQ